MGVSVDNLTALKNVAADATKLRWVESETSWYWSNPAGTDTPDDLNILTPNVGSGRWYKQLSREVSPNSWQWDIITSAPSTVSSVKSKAYFCNASSDNPITISLPATAIRGDSIRFRKLDVSSWNRRIIIDRNGHKIDGLSSNINFTAKNTDATLIYMDTTVGWVVVSNNTYTATSVITSLNYVSDGDTNGLFQWIGTNKNTVAWTNPAGTVPFVKVITFMPGTSLILDTFTNNTALTNKSNEDNFAYTCQGCILHNLSVDTYRPFRLVRLSVKTTSSALNASRSWKGFNIYGSTAFGNITTPLSGLQYNKLDWTLLKSYTNDNTMPATANTWCHYTIDAPTFYDCYKIVFTQPAGDASAYYALSDIEMYGDAAW